MGITSSFFRVSFMNPLKGELGSKLQFYCVHFIKLRHLIEEEITVQPVGCCWMKTILAAGLMAKVIIIS